MPSGDSGVADRATNKNYPSFKGTSSSLTHLELKNSLVTPQNLCTMLKIPKALVTFIYYEIDPMD
jgi:hypothetical protein